MRDEPNGLAVTRDEDALDPSHNVAQPTTPRLPLSSASALHSASPSAQGSFVASFAMTRAEQQAYVELAKSRLPTLVAECAQSAPSASDGSEWKRLKFKKRCDVQVWEKSTESSSVGASHQLNALASAVAPPLFTYAVRSAVRVPAPLDVVLRTLDCSAVTTYRSFTKIIYESLVAETSVLYHSQSLAPPSSSSSSGVASESLAVRWMVCRCNNPIVSDCDLCFLEYAEVHSVDDPAPTASNGQALFRFRPNNHSSSNSSGGGGGRDEAASRSQGEGLHDRDEFPSAYKVLCSVETKSCPELLDSHRLTRCFVPLGGFLFYPTDTVDATDIVFYMSVAQQDPHAVSLSDRQFRAVQRVLQRMARGAGRIKNAVDAYTMSLRLEMLRNTRWVRNTERAECVVCYRRFHQLTRRRHHCRLCGDVICRDCSVYKDADLPTIGPTILRVCKLCDLNELKGSAGSTATVAVVTVSTPTAKPSGDTNSNSNNNDDGNNSIEQKGPARQDPAPEVGKKLTRKRSTTLNVDMSKAVVHEQQHGPEVGRRFTTVVDGKDRRELPAQVFSCSKADIAGRSYKWNTGGGGKPLVILSPASAALYATRTSGDKATKAATPVSRTSLSHAPQDWHVAMHPAAPATPQSRYPRRAPDLPQAKSCSKVSPSSFTPFDKFLFRGKAPDGRELHASASRPRGVSSVYESDRRELDEDDEQPSSAAVHPSRVVKAGKLVVPGHDDDVAKGVDGTSNAKKTKKKTKLRATKATTAAPTRQHALSPSNQHRDVPSSDLVPRKLAHVDKYEDILLKLCEEIAKAVECKYAAVSLFTASTSSLLSPHATSGADFASLPAAHYLKADGSKKLTKVAATLMCCAPVLELKEKLITRDALASCNMFDFKRLPIVLGPQQVRFYAGIPLLDTNQHMVGALAVFDSGLYQGASVHDVLPRMSAFARIALAAIEDRKTELELKSFLEHPLVDPTRGNQAMRVSEPVFHIDMDLDDLSPDDDDYGSGDDNDDADAVEFRRRPRHHSHSSGSGAEDALQLRQRLSAYPDRLQRHPPPPAHDVEYYKNQMEQLVRQARETEAQMLETSMAMKRQGVAIW